MKFPANEFQISIESDQNDEKDQSDERNEIQSTTRWREARKTKICFYAMLGVKYIRVICRVCVCYKNRSLFFHSFMPEDKNIKQKDKILFGLSRTTWDQWDEFESNFAPAFCLFEFISAKRFSLLHTKSEFVIKLCGSKFFNVRKCADNDGKVGSSWACECKTFLSATVQIFSSHFSKKKKKKKLKEKLVNFAELLRGNNCVKVVFRTSKHLVRESKIPRIVNSLWNDLSWFFFFDFCSFIAKNERIHSQNIKYFIAYLDAFLNEALLRK